MELKFTPTQLAVCADSDAQRLYWQDLEQYRTMSRRRRVVLAKEFSLFASRKGVEALVVHNERVLTHTALALVGCLERGKCEPEGAIRTINNLWQQAEHVPIACKLGWLVDYIRLTYQYL